MSEMAQVLAAALSADAAQRESAMTYLQSAQVNNPGQFMALLATELANSGNDPVIRQQAGLQIKNCLATREDGVTQERIDMWCALDDGTRAHIKGHALMALGTESEGFLSAPQVVATIAIAEIPRAMWLDLVPFLVQQFSSGLPDVGLQAILETLGYICQDVDPEHLQAHANAILTAVIGGMQHSNANVKLAATSSLTNAVAFCKVNFNNDNERNIIMQTVCEATVVADTRVKVAALQCLNKIMDVYYALMEQYMAPALFGLTIAAMHSDNREVQLQGVEFWSNVCDSEIALIQEMEDAARSKRAPNGVCFFYAKGALGNLVPLLLQLLTVQSEDDDREDWTVAKGAAVCLDLLSCTVRDDILSHVVPFVQNYIASPEWNVRDAAVQAFAALLDGPSADNLTQLVTGAIMHLLALIEDPSPQVKDSLAWAIGRICDLIPESIVNDNFLPHVVTTLLYALAMESRVADNACWAINALAEAAYRMASSEGTPATYALSPYFNGLVVKLFEVTDRPDATRDNLRSSAFEAIMALVGNFAADCYPSVTQALMQVITKLQVSLQLNAADRDELMAYSELQSLLCASLHIMLKNMHKEDVLQVAQPIMQILLAVFQSPGAGAASVQEDGLLALQGLIETMEGDFLPFMEPCKPYIMACLARKEEYEVCKAAVGVIGDLCRALGTHIQPHITDFMTMLMQALADENLDQSVKPVILGTFGDIATAIGLAFQAYLDMTLQALAGAAGSAVAPAEDDDDTIDFTNQLREGILEAFTGVLAALKGQGGSSAEVQLLVPYVPSILQFMTQIQQDDTLSDDNLRLMLGLVGDLCDVFGRQLTNVLSYEFVSVLVSEGLNSTERQTKSMAKWAKKIISKVVSL